MMKTINGMIFDMDGLMFDTENLSSDCWVRVGNDKGFAITRELIDSTRGLDRRKTKRILEDKFGEEFDFDVFSDESRVYMDESIRISGMPIKKGLLELLNYLKEKKCKCALASSTERKRVMFYLKTAELENYFDVIVCGDDISRGKPYPDIFLKAAEEMGLRPEKCMVLEDSKYGVEAAYRAGISVVMIPDMIFPDGETVDKLYAKKQNLLEVIDLLETE